MMPDKWPMRSVSELQDEGVLLVEDGNHGEYRPRSDEFGEGDYAFIRAADMNDGRVLFESAQRIDDVAIARIRKGIGRGGDILLSHKGTVGKLALAPLDSPPFVCSPQTTFWRTLDQERLDRKYLYCFMRSRAFTRQWMARSNETDMAAYVSLTAQRQFNIAVPPVAEQRAIADVLSVLDDKIDQNRRTARALEQLAQAIFRAWFVDFEPVKARVAGATAFPSMPQPVFDVMPTRFVDSDIGLVPEGWESKAASEAFDVNPTRRLRKGELAPYLDMKNMPTNGHAPDSWVERPFGSGMRFMNGDTLVARITPCLENGKTAFVDFLEEGQIAWGSTEYIVLRPLSPLPPLFAYCLARTDEFRDFAIQNMTGTSGRQRVASTAMDHFRFAVPSKKVSAEFGKIVSPMFNCIRGGIEDSRKLAEMRDYLLPRLLSGDVRVEAAHTPRGEPA